FGVLTLTWAFSGLLSMEPWAWTEQDQIERGVRQAFAGGSRDLASFPKIDSVRWAKILQGQSVKEIEFAHVLDEPSYIVRTSLDEKALVGWPDGGHQPYFVSRDPDASRFVVSVKSMAVSHELTSDVILNRLK